jgi:PilZ domain-containing protein
MVALLKMPRQQAEPLNAERRLFPRKEVHSWIEGRRLDHSLSALRDRRVSLALRDLSLGGMSAIAHAPMEAGERLCVFFPPQGAHRGWDAYGRVIRCEPSATGYRVAVEFDPLPAA